MQKLLEEFRKFIAVPKNLVFLIAGPMFFTLLFGFVYTNDYLNDIPVAVLDLDQSETSRMIVRTFDENDRYQVVASVLDQSALEALMQSREAHLGLFIPPGFEADIKRGRETSALLVVDGTNIAIGNNALSSASEILNTLNGGVAIKVLEGKGASPEKAERLAKVFQFNARTLYDPKLSYKTYMMPGFVLVLVQQLFLSVFVPNLIEDPVNRLQKGVVHIGAGVLAYGLCLLELRYLLKLPLTLMAFPVVLVSAIYLFSILGSAMTIGAIFRDRLKATQICMMLSTPTFLLAGYVWPVDQMPQALAWTVRLIWPLIEILSPIRAMLIKGTALTHFLPSIAYLILFGAAWYAVGSRLVGKRLSGA